MLETTAKAEYYSEDQLRRAKRQKRGFADTLFELFGVLWTEQIKEVMYFVVGEKGDERQLFLSMAGRDDVAVTIGTVVWLLGERLR